MDKGIVLKEREGMRTKLLLWRTRIDYVICKTEFRQMKMLMGHY